MRHHLVANSTTVRQLTPWPSLATRRCRFFEWGTFGYPALATDSPPFWWFSLKSIWISNGHFWIQDIPNPSQCQLQSITKHWQISRHISQKSAQYYRISTSPKIDKIIAKSPLELGYNSFRSAFLGGWRLHPALDSRATPGSQSSVGAWSPPLFTAMICICKDAGTDLTWLDYTDLTYDLTT